MLANRVSVRPSCCCARRAASLDDRFGYGVARAPVDADARVSASTPRVAMRVLSPATVAPLARASRRARPFSSPVHRRAVAGRRRFEPPGSRRASRSDVSPRASTSTSAPPSTSDPEPPSESESRPSLAGYPEDRGRLSLALDPYSRMSLPNRKGNPEVQKRPTSDIFWGFLLCFLTLAILTLVDARVHVTRGLPFLHGAWATISVLAFGTLDNPAARVYNCVVGTVASTFIAAALIYFIGPTPIARALGISVALAFMMWTGSVHPPGAACVFAAVDSAAIQSLGFWYVVYPVLFGSLFILAMGRLCHALKHRYEFVIAWCPRRGGVKSTRGAPALYAKPAFGFRKFPVGVRGATERDVGGRTEEEALNDAVADTEGILLDDACELARSFDEMEGKTNDRGCESSGTGTKSATGTRSDGSEPTAGKLSGLIVRRVPRRRP